jgi:hypothetical protein
MQMSRLPAITASRSKSLTTLDILPEQTTPSKRNNSVLQSVCALKTLRGFLDTLHSENGDDTDQRTTLHNLAKNSKPTMPTDLFVPYIQ